MLRHSVQRISLRNSSLKSLAAYTTAIQPTAKQVVPAIEQASNCTATWSENQRAKLMPCTQPNPMAAIDLIAEEPIKFVKKRIANCDGGGGPLGHPRVYINLDKPEPQPCGYCGIRFQKLDGHHH
ncbi:unnamed protein product [Rhizopus stolonifer]